MRRFRSDANQRAPQANPRSTGERHTIADIETQLTFYPLPHHEVITGITYRSNADQQRNSQWFNYRVNAATTTYEAINVLATRSFDLVLMDCEIPAPPHESRLLRDWTRPPSVDCARNQPIVGQESGL